MGGIGLNDLPAELLRRLQPAGLMCFRAISNACGTESIAWARGAFGGPPQSSSRALRLSRSGRREARRQADGNPVRTDEPGTAQGRRSVESSGSLHSTALKLRPRSNSGPNETRRKPRHRKLTLPKQEVSQCAAVVLICAGLLGVSPPEPTDYSAAAARAGRDAAAHFKLAVWCESHGMDAERLKHLALTLAIDPQNAAARGMMGLVGYGGRWLSPEKVGDTIKADEAMTARLAQYEARRQATPESPQAQWELALWCEKHGLKAEATAHLTTVTRLDPRRTEAWHRLGCQLYKGRWRNVDQAAAERANDEAQKKADRYWQPYLQKWQKELVFDNPRRRPGRIRVEGHHRPACSPVDPTGPGPRQSGPAGDGRRDAQPDRLPGLFPRAGGAPCSIAGARSEGLRSRS